MTKPNNFYVIRKPDPEEGRLRTEGLTWGDPNLADPPQCPVCKGWLSMMIWLPPFRIELETWEKGFGDWAECSGNDVLVSERFKALYEEHGVRGLNGFEPVEIKRIRRHRKFPADPPNYFRVVAVRSSTTIDHNASGFEFENPEKVCPKCRSGGILKRWKRVVMEPGTWDGFDLFCARGMSGTVFCTPRFRQLANQYGLTGMSFLPAEQYAHDFYPRQSDGV